MRYRSPRGNNRAAVFDKARWVGTPPRFRIDRYLVLRLVPVDEEPDRLGPDGQPPAAPEPGPGPKD